MTRRLAMLVSLLAAASPLAGCAGGPQPPSGRWLGQVGAPCPGTALLQTGHGEAVFVRDDGAQTLRGTIALDGAVTARVETPGLDKKGFVQTFTGRVQGDQASGTYASPRCTAEVTLHAG
jgi:hypothetical protein